MVTVLENEVKVLKVDILQSLRSPGREKSGNQDQEVNLQKSIEGNDEVEAAAMCDILCRLYVYKCIR